MPRITPLRIVLLPVFLYIFAVFLWVVLPCLPRVDSANYSHYHQDVLRTGKTLTTTYENKRLYDRPENEDNTWRRYFSLDWRLQSATTPGDLLLHVGTDNSVNLTIYNDVQTPYIDEPILVSARAGQLDGVMMPWFTPADASLLNWEIEHNLQVLALAVVVPEPGIVQLWPECTRLRRKIDDLPANDDELKPFITLSNIPAPGEPDLSHIRVKDMTWEMPSLAFPVRRFILHALKPVTLNVVGPVIEAIFFSDLLLQLVKVVIIAATCGTTVVIGGYWLAAGRPPFSQFLHTLPVMQWARRTPAKRIIYGPAGVIAEEDQTEEFDEQHHVDRHEPQPLRGIGDFFRSRSPLDDLFVSFRCTQWLLEPLNSRQSRTRSRFEPSDGVTVTAIEEGKIKLEV